MTPPPATARARAAVPAPAPRPVRKPRPVNPANRRPVGRAVVESVNTAADSPAVSWVSRGNRWMPLMCILLIGMVALSVNLVRINASAGEAGARADQLRRENSELQVQIAAQTSGRRVEIAANDLGMFLPLPEAIRSIAIAKRNAETAAARLLAGEVTFGTFIIDVPGATDGVGAVVADGVEAAPVTETAPATSGPDTGTAPSGGQATETQQNPAGNQTPSQTPASGGSGGGGGGAL